MTKKDAASTIDPIRMSGNKAKGARPYFLNDPMVERVLNITLSLATELAVTRERLDTLERILEQKDLLSREEIETFRPTDTQAQERQEIHAQMSARILRIVQQEIEAIAHPENNQAMHDIADDINEM